MIQPAGETTEQTKETQQKEPKKILLADDNNELIETLELILVSQGFATSSACDGVEAKHQIEKDQDRIFDCVITDVLMPGLSGWDLLRWLRTLPKYHSHRMILMSGVNYESDRFKDESLQPFTYLCKPFGLEELLEAVQKTIAR